MVCYLLIVVVVPSPSHVQLFMIPQTVACQASLSLTISWSLLKFMSIALVMPSNHLILCHPLLLLLSIFPSIRVFSIESAVRIRWSKYWSFSISLLPCIKQRASGKLLNSTGSSAQSSVMTEMDGWHHQCNGRELGENSGDGEGQGGLACHRSWGHKESDMTE